jgi:hypothetical protein
MFYERPEGIKIASFFIVVMLATSLVSRASRSLAVIASCLPQEAADMKKTQIRTHANKRRPKKKLGLPDLEYARTAVLNSLRSPESKRGYRYSINEFVDWYCSEPRLSLNKTVVTRYRTYLEERLCEPHDIVAGAAKSCTLILPGQRTHRVFANQSQHDGGVPDT